MKQPVRPDAGHRSGATFGRPLSFANADRVIDNAVTTTPLAETHLFRIEDGLIVENYVGALNPLQWEMIYSDAIKREVLT